ncbi:transmembrane channel-like protein 1 isoform X3 [Branchiostoma floridae x Branchiostoma japonicum]
MASAPSQGQGDEAASAEGNSMRSETQSAEVKFDIEVDFEDDTGNDAGEGSSHDEGSRGTRSSGNLTAKDRGRSDIDDVEEIEEPAGKKKDKKDKKKKEKEKAKKKKEKEKDKKKKEKEKEKDKKKKEKEKKKEKDKKKDKKKPVEEEIILSDSSDEGGADKDDDDDEDSDDVETIEETDGDEIPEETILENIQRQKEIIASIRKQPWRMKKKLKTLRVAQEYLNKYEGRLSKGKGYKETFTRAFKKIKRELSNFISIIIPWETRIKTIESYFGSVVASYFLFLRWLFWINIVLTIFTMAFVIIPELVAGYPYGAIPRKTVPKDELHRAAHIGTVWDFGGYLQYSVLFYGYYGNAKSIGSGYQLPLAYFLVGIITFVYSFAVILRQMAKNSRMSKMSTSDDQFQFCWKVFCGWDYLIGNSETADNKVAAITTGLREAILEEEEKNKDEQSSKKERYITISLRLLANVLVTILLAGSGYAIQLVVERSEQFEKMDPSKLSWWEQNEVSMVVSIITMVFPVFFDLIGEMEKYHPRVMLRWSLARVMVLNLGNLYTLMIALFKKVNNLADEARKAREALQALEAAAYNNTLVAQNATAASLIREAVAEIGMNNTAMADILAQKAGIKEQCWETIVGQEMFKLSVFDMIATVVTTFILEFLRGLFVRFANYCWCWDLETGFPGYAEFGVADNVLHLIYNQGMIWMGAFFAPSLPALNVLKLIGLMYLRSWAVMMCNIPHERVFRASRSNNFYLVLLLIMLFLSMLPTGYVMVSIEPSRNCGPFSGKERIFDIISDTVNEKFPPWMRSVMAYLSTAGVMIPLFMLLIMAIYYLQSLLKSYKEANNDLRIQLQYERTEGKKKVYEMSAAKNGGGGNAETTENAAGATGGVGRGRGNPGAIPNGRLPTGCGGMPRFPMNHAGPRGMMGAMGAMGGMPGFGGMGMPYQRMGMYSPNVRYVPVRQYMNPYDGVILTPPMAPPRFRRVQYTPQPGTKLMAVPTAKTVGSYSQSRRSSIGRQSSRGPTTVLVPEGYQLVQVHVDGGEDGESVQETSFMDGQYMDDELGAHGGMDV